MVRQGEHNAYNVMSKKHVPEKKVAIIKACFYQDIVDGLEAQAMSVLRDDMSVVVERIDVVGAFELPSALHIVSTSGEGGKSPYAGYLLLGCIIRGETDHDRYVCESCFRGLMDVILRGRLAVGMGILTLRSREQAQARLVCGARAGRACLQMMALQDTYRG
ncbi:MAG: 6,7-dimethyl-8-ribityllumazine synthase [Alphaproteobacteria bacterium GM7ARS4]|nr:6,7-dimethyl-8-ribityllumazine synthase [Alphaproteobacteria bacterium GM7ARS4]